MPLGSSRHVSTRKSMHFVCVELVEQHGLDTLNVTSQEEFGLYNVLAFCLAI